MGIYKDFYGKAREEGLTRAALEETLTLMDQATSIMRVPAEDLKILMPHPDGMVVGDSYLFREVDPNKIGSTSAKCGMSPSRSGFLLHGAAGRRL